MTVGPEVLTPRLEEARTRRAVVAIADAVLKRLLDVVVAVALLALALPLILLVAAAIKVDSRGPVFYRCHRVGYRGRTFLMLKFRKMLADAVGPALTVADDARLTRVGRILVRTKLDELPQLWNVVKGEMSLVGPRPEDPSFVELRPEYEQIVRVKPGITGLCQLAFAKEAEVLDSSDRVTHYVEHLLPQKVALDSLYAASRSFVGDLRILWWTAVALLGRQDVAVHRETGALTRRRRARRTLVQGASR